MLTTDKDITATHPLPYSEWSLDFLADYITNMHHNYVNKTLPELMGYANKVAGIHGHQHPEFLTISDLVDEISIELTTHLMKGGKSVIPVH